MLHELSGELLLQLYLFLSYNARLEVHFPFDLDQLHNIVVFLVGSERKPASINLRTLFALFHVAAVNSGWQVVASFRVCSVVKPARFLEHLITLYSTMGNDLVVMVCHLL